MRLGSKRIISARENTKKKAMRWLFFIILIFCFFGTLIYSFWILRPALLSMATSKAKEIATLKINQAISQQLKNEKISYEDLLEIKYDDNGKIVSVKSELSNISALKSDLALKITEEISKIQKSELSIPLGTLSGIDILYGMGPDIPVKIKPYGCAQTDLKTNFYSSGINQTVFEINAQASASVSILMPTIKKAEKISSNIPVASVVVVGDVPQNYTNIDREGYQYEEDAMELMQ